MGGRAEQQITRAVESLIKRDDALAAQVIVDDDKVDEDELAIDELCFFILARRQPVASDLRFVTLAMKIVTDLERIGDLATNIAKRVRELNPYPPLPIYSVVEEMATMVMTALRNALDAFVGGNADVADQVIKNDCEIDTLNNRVFAEVIAKLSHDSEEAVRGMALTSVSRYLERIGDHATNIAEMVIFFVRGRDVRHHAVKH